MKKSSILLALILMPISLNAQLVSVTKTVSFTYDLNGNITGRKQSDNFLKTGDEWKKPTYPDDIDIINKGDLIKIDMKKDYNSVATMQICNASPIVVKSECFTNRVHTVDMSNTPSGIYLINVKVEDNEWTKKVVRD